MTAMTTDKEFRITVSGAGTGHQLGKDFLIRAVTLLKELRRIKVDVIDSNSSSEFSMNASSSIKEVLSTLSSALESMSRKRESEIFEYVLAKCNDAKTFGGLGLSKDSVSEESDRSDALFLIESWLNALNSQDRVKDGPPPVAMKSKTVKPMTLAQKILSHHTVDGCPVEGVRAGDVIRVALDWVIASELTWTVS
jgi:hypothetical protein